MPATLIKTDGTETPLIPANGTDFTLAELQAAVGGYIEVVNLPNDRILIVNEEGNFEGLPTNDVATMRYLEIYSGPNGIVGNVVEADSDMIR